MNDNRKGILNAGHHPVVLVTILFFLLLGILKVWGDALAFFDVNVAAFRNPLVYLWSAIFAVGFFIKSRFKKKG